MPNLIFKVNNYKNEDAVEKVLNYIANSIYIDAIGTNNCFVYNGQPLAEGVVNSFQAVKNVYYKNDGQMLHHIIIGFEDMDRISGYDVECVAIQISDYFLLKGFQTFWGVHWGSDKRDKYWHIHIAVNTINGMTGERYFATYDDRNELKQYLEGVYPEWPWHHYPSESYYH